MVLLEKVALKVPVVVRLEDTNVDRGKRILKVNVNFDYGIQSCTLICPQ